MILHALTNADREDDLYIFRLEQTMNNFSILVPGTRIHQVNHERDMSTASQSPGLASVTRREPRIMPQLDVGAAPTCQIKPSSRRDTPFKMLCHVYEMPGDATVPRMLPFGKYLAQKILAVRVRILEQSPTLLSKHCLVEHVQITQASVGCTDNLNL